MRTAAEREAAMISAALSRLSVGCRQTLLDAESDVYLRMLLPYGGEAVSRACDAILRDPDAPGWFPRTQEIIARITGSRRAAAIEAWHKFRAGVSRYAGRTVAFDDPLIHHCAATLGGWNRIGLSSTGAVDKLRDDFLALYSRAIQHAPDPADVPRRLDGEDDAPVGMAVPIGNRERSLTVLRGDMAQAITTARFGLPLAPSHPQAITRSVAPPITTRNHQDSSA